MFNEGHFPFSHIDQSPSLFVTPDLDTTIVAPLTIPLVTCQPVDHTSDVLPFNLLSHSPTSPLFDPIVPFLPHFGVHNNGT